MPIRLRSRLRRIVIRLIRPIRSFRRRETRVYKFYELVNAIQRGKFSFVRIYIESLRPDSTLYKADVRPIQWIICKAKIPETGRSVVFVDYLILTPLVKDPRLAGAVILQAWQYRDNILEASPSINVEVIDTLHRIVDRDHVEGLRKLAIHPTDMLK